MLQDTKLLNDCGYLNCNIRSLVIPTVYAALIRGKVYTGTDLLACCKYINVAGFLTTLLFDKSFQARPFTSGLDCVHSFMFLYYSELGLNIFLVIVAVVSLTGV